MAIVNEIFILFLVRDIAGNSNCICKIWGCSLRCGLDGKRKLWCDTGYALSDKAGTEMDLDSILAKVESFSKRPTQILLTGGEPLEGEEIFVPKLQKRFI